MLEEQFFPTPLAVIGKLMSPYRTSKYARILEPSAGSGAILDYIRNTGDKRPALFACEINTDLAFTLQGKGYKLIERDFLRLADPLGFNLIVMNPPFSEACKHVLHAWSLLSDGGELAALVNAETCRNQYTKERQLLGYIADQYGTVEYIGQAFKNAERPTGVEVALIRLTKPAKEDPEYFSDFKFSKDEAVHDEAFAANPLAHGDIIKSIVAQYDTARQITIERSALQRKLDFFLNGVEGTVYDENKYYKDQDKEADALAASLSLREQLEILKSRFWNTVFVRTKLASVTTSDFRKKFDGFAASQASMSFTEDNVRELLELLFNNRQQIMTDCLVTVFDEATKFHEKNKVHTEGWKTNKGWKINKRIIHPNGIRFDRWGFWSENYSLQNFLNDIDKSLCWLSGQKLDDIQLTRRSICNHIESIHKGVAYDTPFESTFFRMRVFKKGTIHMDFKDLELLAKFNRVAAEGKNWIGGEGF